MTTKLRRSIATVLAALIYVQAIYAGPYPVRASAPLIRAASSVPGIEPVEPAQAPAGLVVVFGPNQYVRTTGAPNIYTASFATPAWLVGPHTMHVVNGSPTGDNRLSSTTIILNGVEVAVPGDFGQQVAEFDKDVTLQAQNSLELRVTSIPQGYLTLWFFATNGDHTAPQLAVTSPPNGVFMNTDTATITVLASDPAGAGEPAPSGLNLSTLRILVDGVDRTASFTIVNGVATAQIGGLAQGPHAIAATIADVAGNAANTASGFTIDRSVPQLSVTAPANNAFLNGVSTTVTVQVADASGSGVSGIDPATLHVSIDGADRTAEFTLANGTATADIAGLAEGSHAITVSIADIAGNTGTTSSSFTIDRTAPQLAVTSPPNGVFMNTETATIAVQASDTAGPGAAAPSGINLSTLQILVDGVDRTASFTTTNGLATAQFTGLAAGPHAISATISDVAGNAGSVASGFTIDLTAPQVSVTAPANGAFLNGVSTAVALQVADASGPGSSGIDAASLAILIDGANRTAEFTLANGTATAELALAEGAHDINASIADVAGNTGTTSSGFTIDRNAPQLAVTSPANGAFRNTDTATITVQAGDSAGTGASGVDLSTLHILVDGVDRTASFTITNGIATAQFTGLAAGTHAIDATISDVAGNSSTASSSFTIDLTGPQVSIITPVDAAFLNGVSTTVTVQAADATGSGSSGINAASFAILIDGANRTAEFTLANGTATAQVALAEGAHAITVSISDIAGNTGTTSSSFLIDRTAPQLAVTSPAIGAFLNIATATITVQASDTAGPGASAPSGINLSTLHILVDGVDRTASFTTTSGLATAQFTGLAAGAHAISATISDVAGNAGSVASSFTIDLTAPQISVTAPGNGAFDNSELTTVTVQVADAAGSGIDPATLHVAIDGANRTAEFVLGGGTATAQLTGLAEGTHDISASIADVAGNTGTASSSFTIDRIAPQIVIVDPAAGQYTSANAIDVSGGVIDATAVTVLVDGNPATVSNGGFAAGGIAVGTAESQDITVLATDAAGNTATATVTINIDRAVPAIAFVTPAAGAVLAGSIVAVSGTVSDRAIALVEVNGQMMTVSGETFSGEVPANEGSMLLHATAHDKAGNQASVERTLFIDNAVPVLTILEPAPGTITGQASIQVRVSVSDASATTVSAGGMTLTPVNGVFEAILPLPSDGTNLLIVTAVDAAGNEASADVMVVSDRTPPNLHISGPAPGQVISSDSFIAQGTVEDLTAVTVRVNGDVVPVSGLAWQATLSGLAEGATTFSVNARDAAGNESNASRSVTIDLNEPVLTITSPPAGLLTTVDTIPVTGTLQDVTAQSVTVNGVTADVQPAPSGSTVRTFTATVPLPEGDTTIVASAVDAADRQGSAQVIVTRDSIAPEIALTVGPKVTRARPAAASIVATDLGLDRVTVSVNGTLVQTFTAPPFALMISTPEGSRPGDVLTVVAAAFDRVGNSTEATAQLPVASDGAVVGQVLSDVTGLPIVDPPATVAVDGASAVTTDARGRYSFATGEPRISLTATADGMTTVDRTFDVASEAGTSALDARLTPIAPAVTVGAAATTITVAQSGAPASSTSLNLLVPAGAFSDGSSLNATSLSGQGLPGLLPLGWSPIAALDIRGPTPSAPLTLHASNAGTQAAYLVRYVDRQWRLISGALAPDAGGTIDVLLPPADSMAVALVVADDDVAVPAFGDPLIGVDAVAIPLTATSTGVLDPPMLSPSGGASLGTLTVLSPTPLPSGTIVQAVVTETFTLTNGDIISEDARTQDFVLYRHANGIAATFPVVPSRSFTAANLTQGIVHLDILAGRESVRGQAGGNGAVTLTTTGATLSVAQGALTADVPIVFQSSVLSSFLPSTADVAPLFEFAVDFSGRTLSVGADFSVAASQFTLAATDALVVVRVESIGGVSRLVPVAIGELSGDRYFARASHGLSGITRGGRHVWYRVAGGVGFVRGSVDASGTALSATVETSALPFAAVAEITGVYATVARPGDVTVRARAQGTSLVGEATTPVTVNTESSLNISLVGEVSAATIAPANGAIQVSPAIQVEVSSPVSITAASVTGASIQFTQTDPTPGAVPFRVILSGSGRTLAIVPLARLADGATYSVAVSGLADAVGGAIVVPPTAFTIVSNSSPQYDLDKLVFSFPNDEGLVTLTGPPGTLAPGSTILVVNESTGEVSSLGVNNDGSVSEVGGQLVANISDRLIVTITDLQGRQTTFKRSEYVAEDGTTAVGNGGGAVHGDGGVEVRIPEDAVMNGVAAILKIAAVSPDQLPEGPLPDLPGATVATSLKLESPQPPSFQKEVDLAFPKPADAPADATYFVYRRLTGPDGKIAYESIDYADVEGEGANAKVVTASYPFSGYVSSINGYNLTGTDFTGAIGNQLTNYAILMWAFDEALPGRALGGVITGKVLRVKWDPGAATPTYEPVVGALVSGVDGTGDPLFATGTGATVAVSQADGTYSMFDRRYTGGAITISATHGGVKRTATAYEVDPQNTKSPGLRFARNVATATVTFPALPPAVPPSPVVVSVMTLDSNGVRKPANGIVITGQPLIIGVRSGDNTVQRVDVKVGTDTTEYGVRVDPLAPNAGSFDVIASGDISFALPGSFTITANALSPVGNVITGATVIRVAAPGGGNNESLPNDPPLVITARTVPKANAVGVMIGALPQIVFTEPVQNVPAGVTLTEEGGGSAGILLSGVGPNGPIATLSSASIVTSITIQPIAGLKFGTRYTLSLSSDIVDTDDGSNNTQAHKPLAPYSTSFTTFMPESIGRTEDLFTAGGMTVIGDRAYVATPQSLGRYFTNLRLFNIGDPTQPQEVGSDAPGASQIFKAPPAWWLGMPVDVASQEESDLTGGRLVAVAVAPLFYPYHTSNVRLYNVDSDEQWQWIGAVSLGREPTDGMIRRIELKGPTMYAVTAGIGKGIQIVDLFAVKDAFDAATVGGEQAAGFWHMQGELNSMQGFAQQTIVQTIPVNTGSGDNSQLWDLAVTDMSINGVTTTGIIATGRSPLVIASETDGLLYNGEITDGVGGPPLTSWGYGVAAGTIDGTPIAVVSALGSLATGGHVLAIVDLSNPVAPRARAIVPLPGSASAVQDVVLRDENVFIGTNSGTYVVNIADVDAPRVIGTIPEVSGRLAFSSDGLLFGNYRGLTQVTHAEGGLKSAVLGPSTIIHKVTENPALLAFAGQSIEPQMLEYKTIPPDPAITSGTLEVLRDGEVFTSQDVALTNGAGSFTIPAGMLLAPNPVTARLVVAAGEPDAPNPIPKRLLGEKFVIAPRTAVTVSADDDSLNVIATNKAVTQRLADKRRSSPYEPPRLIWLPAGGPGSVEPMSEAASTGIWATAAGFKTSGTPRQIELYSENTLLARSATIPVIPGVPVSGQVTVTAPAGGNAVPADGTSWVTVVADNVRDQFGNTVADGTEIEWEIPEGNGGQFEFPTTTVTSGRSINRYRAGVEPGDVSVLIGGEELGLTATIAQVRLKVEVTLVGNTLSAHVSSDAGLPADGTPIFFGTSKGRVVSESTLAGGVSNAEFTAPPDKPGMPKFRWAHVFATVGRSRGDIRFEIQGPVTGDVTHVAFDQERVAGNTLPNQFLLAAAGDPGTSERLPSQTTAHVTGVPGTVVPLKIGTLRTPNIEPIAAFPLDSVVDGAAEDYYGQSTTAVDPSVVGDYSHPLYRPGVFRFTGAGGVSVQNAYTNNLSDDFGVNGWVRFDSLTPGQQVIQKAGSYGVELVERNNEPRLAFFVYIAGVRHEVLSTQVIAASTWYHISAHFKAQRLNLSVNAGDGADVIKFEDAPGPVDVSAAPLVLGGSLVGNLDEVALYDWSRPPLMTFEDGSQEASVTLDANGEASVGVFSTGALGAPLPSLGGGGVEVGLMALAAPAGDGPSAAERPDAFAQSLRTSVLQVYEAPDPLAGIQNEKSQAALILEALTETTNECAAAILTGESATWGQTGCDFFAGFLPLVGSYEEVRDSFKTAKNFIDGKAGFFDYLQAGLVLIKIAVAAVPLVRPTIKAITGAISAVPVNSAVARHLTEDGLETLRKTLADPSFKPRASKLSTILSTPGTAHYEALVEIAPKLDRRLLAGLSVALENIGDDLAIELAEIARRHGDDAMKKVTRTLGVADGRLAGVGLPKLNPAKLKTTLNGMATFFTTAPGRLPDTAVKRARRMWVHIASEIADEAKRTEKFENLMALIAEGAAKNIDGFEKLVRKGPGLIDKSTAGFYHAVEFVVRGATQKFGRRVRAVEVRVSEDGVRYIDAVLERTDTLDEASVELKNLVSGTVELTEAANAQLGKDLARARAIAKQTGKELVDVLPNFWYIIRVDPSKLATVQANIRRVLIEHGATAEEAAKVFIDRFGSPPFD